VQCLCISSQDSGAFLLVEIEVYDEVKNKIPDFCLLSEFMFLPSNILQATALQYFKRFYLQWSVMQHHPKEIMYSSFKSSKWSKALLFSRE